MKPFNLLLVFLSFFVITSCSVINPEFRAVQIELENVSAVNIENITFNGLDYGSLQSGNTSEFQIHESFFTHSMPYCEGTVNGQKVGNMVWMICFVDNEDILAPGKYTIEVDYEISEAGSGNLSLQFKE